MQSVGWHTFGSCIYENFAKLCANLIQLDGLRPLVKSSSELHTNGKRTKSLETELEMQVFVSRAICATPAICAILLSAPRAPKVGNQCNHQCSIFKLTQTSRKITQLSVCVCGLWQFTEFTNPIRLFSIYKLQVGRWYLST